MPPIFGILPVNAQRPDPDMVGRMNGAAKYIRPGRVVVLDATAGYMALAVGSDNPLVPALGEMNIQGQWAIMADASLYKRKELSARLGNDKDDEAAGDASLILQAYLKWGDGCMKFLYGDFAFVIFNLNTGAIFCGRDHLGVRPLFYSCVQDTFVFGSELRVVLASFKVKPALRHDYLLDSLVTVKTTRDLSPYENIFRLKPGHYLHCTCGTVSIHPYWHPDPEKTIRFSTEAEYIALFQEKLKDAVTLRCKGVSHLGCELSGGLDSSAVTGVAVGFANESGMPFTAFSNVFTANTGIEFKDEQEFISEMQAFKPMDWVGIDRLNQPIPELLQHTIDIQGCFVQQNFSAFNRGIYEAAGERGVQVLLSGFGGDELVSAQIAMPWNEIIREKQWKVLQDELYYGGVNLKSLLKPGLLAARYLKSLLFHPKFTTGVFSAELLNRRFDNLPLQPDFATVHNLRKRHGLNYRKARHDKTSWRQLDRIMADHLPQRMEYCYTAAAQYRLEYRYPLLDIDLVETCLAFPPWMKLHQGINRYIFREAIKGYVPEKISCRDDKSGTPIPHMYFGLLKNKEAVLDIVNSCSGHRNLTDIFDLPRFKLWYERLVKRNIADTNYLMQGAFYTYLMILLYYRNNK